ncbi:FAD-binding oxidoreductase [Streptomyces sp. A7024]|uniref:FAD-binding oxidoreductase n=1 Tax=Streptomyces coryli TaxID=1128680 RepID=A0A6G4U3I1_9ACTN|nr:FAD-binding oxidoreductase [Streptomyces coryli]NGN66562.1 FAD-binding oxidoreductase [Streptomyces coryli]
MDEISEFPALRPADEGYDAERTGFQLHGPHRPDLIVTAESPDHVRAAVAHARAHGLPVAVQATGHGVGVTADGGVLISTRRMTDVRIDPQARSAYIAAGATWGQVIEAAAPHGLAPLSGSAPSVGAIGYTLGGGLGALSRQYGYAADHVTALDVVTADGEPRHVTAESDPDLFWALRGGRDNFGIVTGMEIGLFPHPEIYGGTLAFAAEHVDAVLAGYLEWTRTLPDELMSAVSMMVHPDVPFVEEEFRGRYVLQVKLAYTGPADEGERLVAPLRALAPTLADDLRVLPFTDSHTVFKDPPFPHGYVGDGLLIDAALDVTTLQTVAKQAGPEAPTMTVLQLRHLGGAQARTPAVPNAVAGRDAGYLLSVVLPVDGVPAETVTEVLGGIRRTMAPLTTGRALNFVFGGLSGAELSEAYAPADLERLRSLKGSYDPENTFRLGQPLALTPGADAPARG